MENKTSKSLKCVAIISAVIVAVGVIIGIMFACFGIKYERYGMDIMQIESEQSPIRLSAARSSGKQSADTYVLTATVTPESAENKEVDWSLTWQSGTELESKSVTEYLTLTPNSNGAPTATLKCVKPFYGSTAIVTVTTRDGGYTASATVTFEGAPTEMTVNNRADAEQLLTETGTYEVTMNNVFGYVGDKYKNNISVNQVTVTGTYTACNIMGRMNTSYIETSNVTDGVDIAYLRTADGISFENCFSATVSGSTLTVSFTEDLFFMCSEYVEQDDYYYVQNAFYGNLDAYADITVRCAGASATLRIHFMLGVTGVSLDADIVTF